MARNSDSGENLRFFLRIYQSQIRFVLWFAAIFLLMNFIYSLMGGSFIQDFIFSSFTAKPTAALIKLISYGENVRVEGNLLTSPFASLQIIDGCEGVQSILILTSAILAYSTSVMRKFTGVLFGVLFLYVVNLLRIVGVYYMFKYSPSAVNVAHFFVGQTIVIMMMFVFFLFWVRKSIDGQERTE
jgi:exosortase family protein XrtM